MTIPVLQAAKYLVGRSGWKQSNLEIQKILYITHMYHLGGYGTSLVYGDFEAWDLGPVHPDLYHALKQFGAGPVTDIRYSTGFIPEGTEKELLEQAVGCLSHKTGGELISMTHWPEGAWAKNYIPGRRNIVIPRADIIEEYGKRTGGR